MDNAEKLEKLEEIMSELGISGDAKEFQERINASEKRFENWAEAQTNSFQSEEDMTVFVRETVDRMRLTNRINYVRCGAEGAMAFLEEVGLALKLELVAKVSEDGKQIKQFSLSPSKVI